MDIMCPEQQAAYANQAEYIVLFRHGYDTYFTLLLVLPIGTVIPLRVKDWKTSFDQSIINHNEDNQDRALVYADV